MPRPFKSFAFAIHAQRTLLLLFIYGQFFTYWIGHIMCISAELDIVISTGPWVDSGTDTTLTCMTSSSGTIREITWSMSSVNASFDDATEIIQYISPGPAQWGNFVDPNHYDFNEALSGFPLTIKSILLDDEAQYWCVLNTQGFGQETSTAVISVRVPPNAVAVSYMGTQYSIDPTPLSVVAGSDQQFTCKANGIKPEVIFTWTYDSSMLQGTPQESTENTNDTRLFDSSNVLTIDIPEVPGEQPLKCGATNRQDESKDAEVEINLMLQVKVPPKGSLMSLYDSSNELIRPETPLALDGGKPYTMTCKVQGTRPEVSIQWMVDGGPHQATDPTHSEVNSLIDTQGMVTFTPTRDNHRKNVTCTASTTESESPYPFVTTALDVTGPPDTPVISGNITMTENVATTLMCTADLGYPDDWTLEWSNEGTAIVNPPTTTADSGQRYMFTSQLEFTPNRQDNTHSIKCTAKRNSWTSPEQTWGPINVQYETNITNKHNSFVGSKKGLTANLSCVAKGNPAPVITWFDPNNTEIIHGGDNSKYMLEVSYTTSDSDMTSGHETTSNLTIHAVNPEVDYGVYTCSSTNGIGRPDSHEINVTGTRRPNMPTGVVMTDRTSSLIAVSWSAGYDGGETQWFHVSHKKTADSLKTFSDKIEGGVTAYNVTGLDSYTEYDIRVYAENDVDRNLNPGSIVKYTLPLPPVPGEGFTIEFNLAEGKVTILGLSGNIEKCIQLEVKYGSSEWKKCGSCIKTDGEVILADVCPQTRKRRRRAAGDVVAVRASFCQETGGVELCSEPTSVEQEEIPVNGGSDSTGIIVGGVVGGVVLLVIIGGLIVYLKRTPPNKPTGTETSSSIELVTDNFGQNGQVNEGLRGSGGAETNAKPIERLTTDSGDTYAIVKKEKRPHPKAPPQNLPDVTYAEVNKKTPVAGLAKKPKKYVPPSKVTEESDYDDVKVPQQNKKSKSGAGSSGYEEVNLDSPKTPANYDDGEGDYANLTEPQSDSGRTVNEDGLIYMEVGHLKSHPVNQPPIQTEESTTYASIDFLKKTPDVARN